MAFREDLYPDDYFDGLHRRTWFAAPERKWLDRDRDIVALARPAPDKTILDLGSARGDVCFLLADKSREVIGVDASERAVEIAERRRRELGLSNVRFVLGDVADLGGIADASVDVAGAFDLVEHIDDETVVRMLDSLRRVLKPAGRMVAYTPNREHYVERMKARGFLLRQFPQHIAVRRPKELARLVEGAGWRVESLTYSPAPFPVVRFAERLLSRLPGLGRLFRYRILLAATPAPLD
jgi:cyclopropane fatty-acyl-phospholipid synthase-like methyltransferase